MRPVDIVEFRPPMPLAPVSDDELLIKLDKLALFSPDIERKYKVSESRSIFEVI